MRVFDLVNTYGVSTAATASANAAAIQTAFTDAGAVGGVVYLRGAGDPYPCNPLTLPGLPLTFQGDGASVSVLKFPAGSGAAALSYVNTVGLSSTTGPFHTNKGVDNTRYAYQSSKWILRGLGFQGGDWDGQHRKGWDFPKWDASVDPANYLVLHAQDCLVTLFDGDGINYVISGAIQDSSFRQITAKGCGGIGIQPGSDQRWIDCVASGHGQQGFYVNGYSPQLVTCKGWDNGHVTSANGAGFGVTGQSPGVELIGCHAQDNRAEGFQIKSASRVSMSDCKADRNCWFTGNAGLLVADSTDVQVRNFKATDSSTDSGKTNIQLHALKVTNTSGTTNARNSIRVSGSQYPGGRTVTDALDQSSDLNGTDFHTGASEGGVQNVAYAATITPDPYVAQTCAIAALTAAVTVAAPANKHLGARLTVTVVQDATGGRPVNWNAIYVFQTPWTNSGNVVSKRSQASFQYNGSNWVCTDHALNVWY